MPRKLWNEGRVLGLSAYELFVRHILGTDPDATVPTESEWLASMFDSGNSMLLQLTPEPDIAQNHDVHYIDIELPASSNLWAANTIIGSFFYGEGGAASVYNGWCTKVVSYGPLLSNNVDSSPADGGAYPEGIPPTMPDAVNFTSDVKTQLHEFGKIIDGIVIQPGAQWSTNADAPPQKTFIPSTDPDSRYPAVVRIMVRERITSTFYLLLTGFSYRSAMEAIIDYSNPKRSAVDGTFLGPEEYPWANKIVFSVPPAMLNATGTLPFVSDDFIELANGLRMYVALVEPLGSNIPEGSVWLSSAGVKVYSSGEWVATPV